MKHIHKDPRFGEDWFTFEALYSRMVRRFPSGSTFVEVGSWKGRSAAHMAVEIANSNKDIRFYCVDTWQGSKEHQDQDLSGLYETFLDNMRPVEHHYIPLKLTSIEASRKFRDESLDFVFLDASHEYEHVKEDILAWLPKVKPGGVLAGHDYYLGHDYFPGVKRAADELLDNLEKEYDCFVYHKDKLRGFPPVHFISIEESRERRDLLMRKFASHGITNVNGHIFKRYREGDYNLMGDLVDRLSLESKGPLTSHLKAIKSWHAESREPYAFFCEDDLGMDTVKHWNFTWSEFVDSLPRDWGCVQLAWIREEFFHFGFKLRNRCWCDWSGCAYLITREHARRLVEAYHPDDDFHLDLKGEDAEQREEWAKTPVIETIVFSPVTKVYSFPLFVEDAVGCESTYRAGQGHAHMESHRNTMDFWRGKGREMPLSELVDNGSIG